MAAVEVTIRATEYDLLNRTQRQVVLIGEAMLTGLGVGGGPMPPGPGNPPGIWGGGNEPFPTPPIANVPGAPGYRPPGIWGGPIDPYPDHGLPQPPTEPPTGTPDDDGFLKPPPEGGGWAYHEDYGWMYAPKPGGATPHTAKK